MMCSIKEQVKGTSKGAENGEGSGDRTPDNLIKSRILIIK